MVPEHTDIIGNCIAEGMGKGRYAPYHHRHVTGHKVNAESNPICRSNGYHKAYTVGSKKLDSVGCDMYIKDFDIKHCSVFQSKVMGFSLKIS